MSRLTEWLRSEVLLDWSFMAMVAFALIIGLIHLVLIVLEVRKRRRIMGGRK